MHPRQFWCSFAFWNPWNAGKKANNVASKLFPACLTSFSPSAPQPHSQTCRVIPRRCPPACPLLLNFCSHFSLCLVAPLPFYTCKTLLILQGSAQMSLPLWHQPCRNVSFLLALIASCSWCGLAAACDSVSHRFILALSRARPRAPARRARLNHPFSLVPSTLLEKNESVPGKVLEEDGLSQCRGEQKTRGYPWGICILRKGRERAVRGAAGRQLVHCGSWRRREGLFSRSFI